MEKENIRYSELERLCKEFRKTILKIITEAGSGHPGGSLSVVEILTTLYYLHLNHNPKNPFDDKRDRVVLSKGHSCPALYVILAELGYFDKQELHNLRKVNSILQGHPARVYNGGDEVKFVPGIEVSTGSLGYGLSVAVGMALGFKMDNKQNLVFAICSDGEHQEGSIWEAIMFAGFKQLDNLIEIVDYNKLQQESRIDDSVSLEPLKEKYISFNWQVYEVDGHKISELDTALADAKKYKGKPKVIIAHTVKGKGVSFMENNVDWHGKAPSKELLEQALKELEGK
ncbi:MAG: transketolase [Endomicrobia bacterium]|nr:transketolase [Endomicrobiia bacterium]MDW8056202.1 transketolase [Elusimicrobiota bacterium]